MTTEFLVAFFICNIMSHLVFFHSTAVSLLAALRSNLSLLFHNFFCSFKCGIYVGAYIILAYNIVESRILKYVSDIVSNA